MLESIIRFSIKQRLIVMLGTLAIIGLGLWSYTKLPIEAFPDVLNQTVSVITLAPGQSAEDVEKKITLPLEREFSGIPNVIQTRSVSEFGLSVVYLYFEDGVDKYWARSQTMEKMANVTLPSGAQASLAPMASVTGEIFRYEIRGSTYTSTKLRTIQDWMLEKEFRSVPGVADVTGYGGKVRTWDVTVDPLKLATYGITIRQLSDSLQAANQNAGGNLIEFPNQSFVVRSDGELKTMEDIQHVGISQRGNTVIRVGDVAKVEESHAQVRGVVGRDDRDEIVQGIILLRKGENPVVVGEAIKEKIKQLNESHFLPEGVHLVTYYDRLKLVEKTTHTVGKNLIEGLLLVCIVLYLFLRNAYATTLVSLIVPISLLFAFICMIFAHTPANLISLGAIDFGIVVDGAVIIVEYILRKVHEEGDKMNLETSIAEVIRPVFFSMTMIILAYLPIFTLQRVEGKMFSPLAWTIGFVLSGSLVLSLTFIPALLPWVLKRSHSADHEEPAWFLRIQKRYLSLMERVFRNKRKVFIAAVAVMSIGVIGFLASGTEFLPELDEGALWIRAGFPHSTGREEGMRLAREVRLRLKAIGEVETVVSQLGGPEDGTDPNLFDSCEFFVALKPKEKWKHFHGEREALVEFVRNDLERIPGVEFTVSQPIADNVEEAIAGVKGKNAAKIYGPDFDQLKKIGADITELLRKIPGTADVGFTASTPMVPHLTVRIDRVKVAQAGLSSQDVNDLIEIAVGGKTVTQVYDGETQLDVVVRAGERFRSSIDEIRDLTVPLPNGSRIKLDRIADIRMVNAPQAVYRENGFRRMGVKFDVAGRDLGSTMKEILEKAQSLKIPPGYRVEWSGEYDNQKRAMTRLSIVLPATLLLLGLVLFLLFENLGVVSAILSALLLSSVGSILALYIRGIPFSVSSAVGLIVLFGLMALDSVAFASAYVDYRSQFPDMKVFEVIRKACADRLRPILMTSTLASLGLLPAAISHGIGSETQKPLATAVIGGVFTGLPTVLFYLPCILSLIPLRRASTKAGEPDQELAPDDIDSDDIASCTVI